MFSNRGYPIPSVPEISASLHTNCGRATFQSVLTLSLSLSLSELADPLDPVSQLKYLPG